AEGRLARCPLPPRSGVTENNTYERGGGAHITRRANTGRASAPPLDRPPLQTTVPGSQRFGTHLAAELINRGFDVACSWKLHHRTALGHAFTHTLDYLDWDRKGFPYALIPFAVSAYGEDMRMPLPGVERLNG